MKKWILSVSLIIVLFATPVYAVTTYSSLKAAVAAIGSTVKSVLITGSETLSANLTVPSTMEVTFGKGAIITLGAYNLTINGPFNAGMTNIFNCNGVGVVSFGTPSIKEIPIVWFLPDGWNALGTTDYSTQIQAVATAAAGKGLFIPPGTWLGVNVDLPSNIEVFGIPNVSKLKIKAAGNLPFFTVSSKSNVIIRDLYFDGNSANQTGGTPRFVEVINSTNVTLDNLYGYDFYEAGFVAANDGSNIVFRNLTVMTGGTAAGIIAGVADMEVEGGLIKDVVQAIQVPTSASPKPTGVKIRGVRILNPTGQGIVFETDCHHGEAKNNTIYATSATWDAITADQADYCHFIGNKISGSFGLAGIALSQAQYCNVTGNELSGNTTGLGIVLEGGCNENLVSSNLIDSTVGGIAVKPNVDLVNVRNIISGNKIVNATGATADGIYVQKANTTQLVANQIYNSGRHGIFAATDAQQTTVDSNYVHTSTGMGIIISAGSLNDIRNNTVITSGQDGIRFIGAGSVVSGNKIYGSGAAYCDIRIYDAVAVNQLVEGNLTYDGTGTVGYSIKAENALGTNVLIQGNQFYGAAAVFNVANWGSAKIKNNQGLITENGALSAAIATGATIDHGLVATPTIVQVGAAETGPTDVYYSADGTHITVNFGGGGNKTFYWYAVVNP